MTTITQTYYISSGRLNAMYTLRCSRMGGEFAVDNYICNLSTDSEKAEEKARDYYDRISSRMEENDSFKLLYDGYADFDLGKRRGRLSIVETDWMEKVESGVMPFGKNVNKRFEDLPMSTVLWWADQVKSDNEGVVFQAVCNACLGVALDKDYITARQAIRDEVAALDAMSLHVGEIKQRLAFEGHVELAVSIGFQEYRFDLVEKFLTKIRCGSDVLIYIGNKIANKGDTIKFRATIKDHNIRDGVKQTIVQRPTILSLFGSTVDNS